MNIDSAEQEWTSIPDFPMYAISKNGEVKNIKRNKLKTAFPIKDGYLAVNLWKDNKQHTFSVSRLVAKTFIPNPANLPEVNHKDEDVTNNAVENLEWCSRKYNINYGTRTRRVKAKLSMPVIATDEEGNQLMFSSYSFAAKFMGISRKQIKRAIDHHLILLGFEWSDNDVVNP